MRGPLGAHTCKTRCSLTLAERRPPTPRHIDLPDTFIRLPNLSRHSASLNWGIDLYGPFPLSEIASRVEPNSIGVYVLSRNGKHADYVGRSDSDLQARIGNSAVQGDYEFFWFGYVSSPMLAYKTECELYHEYDPPDNAIHPAAPQGTNWRCPNTSCPWS